MRQVIYRIVMSTSAQESITAATQFCTVTLDNGLPFSLLLSWASVLVVLFGAVAVILRWTIRKTESRDPTPFANVVIAQILFFLLFNTVGGIRMMTCTIPTGSMDEGVWYLSLAQTIEPLLGNFLLCTFSLAAVSLMARKFPILPRGTIMPIVIVLLDVTLFLAWATHVVLLRQ